MAIADNSFGYDTTLARDRLSICWRRSAEPIDNSRRRGNAFQRDAEHNNATRAFLEARSTAPPTVHQEVMDEDEYEEVALTEEQARALGARVMLQVLRLFDDPSLEASFGLWLS
eukprot:TRINITY_DN22290_c0_g1_i2.p2 TRINITY_DN22290_c0_g1~~TRINITY_DN22290_c0_g1_i2.p2  ORF type:complete len:114 (-),score=17.53 TRINITY_DN22290_c0_g1_i2:491-832(-)